MFAHSLCQLEKKEMKSDIFPRPRYELFIFSDVWLGESPGKEAWNTAARQPNSARQWMKESFTFLDRFRPEKGKCELRTDPKIVGHIWDESLAAMTPSETKSALPNGGGRVHTLWLLFGFSESSRKVANLLLPSRSSFSKPLELWEEL